METRLTAIECRIVGVLVEKELTTPDYYPLTLNSLLNGCNQKSNRQPVLILTEEELPGPLDHLRHLGLVMHSREGGRVFKFCHTLREKLHLDDREVAILAELMLRNRQTPGELRTRADRMHPMESLEIVESTLQELIDRDTPLVQKLPRQPGQKECRYSHLLCDETTETESHSPHGQEAVQSKPELTANSPLQELRTELEALRAEFEQFKKQFE
ncbi:MAG: DUF480 domain-containing protein [Desulfuromonas sp.]|nr:MAG: DUF480 domain-containing protein [Desulfuromonas sp.]